MLFAISMHGPSICLYDIYICIFEVFFLLVMCPAAHAICLIGSKLVPPATASNGTNNNNGGCRKHVHGGHANRADSKSKLAIPGKGNYPKLMPAQHRKHNFAKRN